MNEELERQDQELGVLALFLHELVGVGASSLWQLAVGALTEALDVAHPACSLGLVDREEQVVLALEVPVHGAR